MGTEIGFVNLWGQAQPIDADLITNVDALPSPHRYMGIVGSKITTSTGGPYYVRGTNDEIAAQVAAAIANEEGGGSSYAPVITSSGAGVVAAIGEFRALQVGGRVHIIGSLNFTPAVPATPETLTITLPSDMQPAANFGATSDASGVTAGGVPSDGTVASDLCTQVVAKVGAKTVQITLDQTTAGATPWSVAFSYSIS